MNQEQLKKIRQFKSKYDEDRMLLRELAAAVGNDHEQSVIYYVVWQLDDAASYLDLILVDHDDSPPTSQTGI